MAQRTRKGAASRPPAVDEREPKEGNGQGGKPQKAKAKAKRDHEHEEKDYKKGRVRLSAGLAETVAGTLVSAMCKDAGHARKIEDSPRYTREYEAFAEMDHPPEVRRWVREMFRDGGPGLAAIESEIEIYVDELSAWMDNALRYHEGHWCDPVCQCLQNPQTCKPP